MNHYGTLRDYRFADKDVDDIRGSNIYGVDDEKLGDIDDVIFDHSTGDIQYVVIDSGGWLSSKKFLVPADRLRPSAKHNNDYQVDMTKQQVEQLPPYDEKAVEDRDRWKEYDDRYQKQMVTDGGVMHRADSPDRIITPPASEGLPSGASPRASSPVVSEPLATSSDSYRAGSSDPAAVSPNSSATGAINMGAGNSMRRTQLGPRWTNFEDSVRRDRTHIASTCNDCKFTPESSSTLDRDRDRKAS